MMKEPISVFTGTSNLPLAKKVCKELSAIMGEDIQLSRVFMGRHSDGEVKFRLGVDLFDDEQSIDEVRGRDVFIIQSTQPPADNFWELCCMVRAVSHRSPRRITVVIPYFGNARQDRKDKSGKLITAKLGADLLEASFLKGITGKFVLVDIHAEQIEGFFDFPVDKLYASYVFIPLIKSLGLTEYTFVAPDFGAAESNRFYARQLNQGDVALIDKRRPKSGETEILNLIGETGKIVVSVDDLADTLRTLGKGALAFKKEGAQRIFAFCTHAVLSGPALDNLEQSPIKKLYVTDTIPLKPEFEQCGKIEVVSVAGMLAAAIHRIHIEESISALIYA